MKAVFLSLIFLTSILDATPRKDIGKIIRSKGQVYLLRSGDSIPVRVRNRRRVKTGNYLITSYASLVHVLFKNGSVLQIGPRTKVRLSHSLVTKRGKIASHVLVYQGIVACKIAKLLNPKPSYYVHTPTMTAAIRGTEFSVAAAKDNSSLITVEEGLVEIFQDQTGAVSSGKGIELKKDEAAETTLSGEPPSKTSPEKEIPLDTWFEEKKAAADRDPVGTVEKMENYLKRCESQADNLSQESQKASTGEKESDEALIDELFTSLMAGEAANEGVVESAKRIKEEHEEKHPLLRQKLRSLERISRSIDSHHRNIEAALERLEKRLEKAYDRFDRRLKKSWEKSGED